MNKSLILVLAICLVSVHAFVKRDAPEETLVDKLTKGLNDGIKSVQENFEKTFNQENMNKITETIKNAVDSLKIEDPKTDKKPEEKLN